MKMHRPVWLLSMDSERFCAPPLTTGGLKAYFLKYGSSCRTVDVALEHLADPPAVERWLDERWRGCLADRAREAAQAGLRPVLGLSCYTWNMAEFLEVATAAKRDVPDLLIVAGGPHVQKVEDFLLDEAIDVIIVGEGEETFAEFLDNPDPSSWAAIPGLAFVDDSGAVQRTETRPRTTELDNFPPGVDVIELRDDNGEPRYQHVAYETSRGCPFRCSFCEWGTGAIGTKMYQYSLERVRHDMEKFVEGGIADFWFCDSNFGALREDLKKAEMLVELKGRTGLPHSFASSWSKSHNARVQDIVRLLHGAGLLWHYHLALQTLTPKALELSHRTNMAANNYEPVVKALAAEGVPVAAELIWGLPGDSLAEFSENLDNLFSVFPDINIFTYTLLPGTEFFERREEYKLVTQPVGCYGKAKGEHVIGCHTFSQDEGEEGYFMVAAHMILCRGRVMSFLLRLLALDARISVTAFMRSCLRTMMDAYADTIPDEAKSNRVAVYEQRADVYLAFLADSEKMYRILNDTVAEYLEEHGVGDLVERAQRTLEIDQALCPRFGGEITITREFDFAVDTVLEAFGRLDMPDADLYDDDCSVTLEIKHVGAAGELLRDPDGGSWFRGHVLASTRDAVRVEAPFPDLAERPSMA